MLLNLKALIQYSVILLLTCLLVWFSLRGLQGAEGEDKWEYLKKTWAAADKGWLILMAFVALASHAVRAERWRMLMDSSGYQTKLSHSFYSLMVGYLVNLVVPRGGEVSRCYNLYKIDKVPVDVSFGTVVLERIVDVICMFSLIAVSFLLESQKLLAFADTLGITTANGNIRYDILLYVSAASIIIIATLVLIIKRNEAIRIFIHKTWRGFKEGLFSVFKLKNKGTFILYSLLIWVLYFAMSFTVIKAFPSTSTLGFHAVLSLFAIGAIAMAAPLPGGAGSYHVLVPQGLVFLYQLPKADAVAFTFIFHGWQTLIMIIAGAISLLITSIILKKKSSSITGSKTT